MLPPYGEPGGPAFDDDEGLLEAFARGDTAGHSAHFHIEGPALLVDGDLAACLRIGTATVLVRADLPPSAEGRRPALEAALRAGGLDLLDNDTLFAPPIAIQVLGLRLSAWDLWGADLEASFADLRAAASGEVGPGTSSSDPFGPGSEPL